MAAPSMHCMFDEIRKTFQISEITDNQRKAIAAVINGHDEVLKTQVYQEKLKLIVVDEAHTVLQW